MNLQINPENHLKLNWILCRPLPGSCRCPSRNVQLWESVEPAPAGAALPWSHISGFGKHWESWLFLFLVRWMNQFCLPVWADGLNAAGLPFCFQLLKYNSKTLWASCCFLHWYPCDGNLVFSWFVEEMAKTMWWSRGLCLLIGIGTRCACLKQAAKKGLQVASFSFERNRANFGCRYILLWEHLWWQSSQMAFAWAATPVGQISLFRWSLY